MSSSLRCENEERKLEQRDISKFIKPVLPPNEPQDILGNINTITPYKNVDDYSINIKLEPNNSADRIILERVCINTCLPIIINVINGYLWSDPSVKQYIPFESQCIPSMHSTATEIVINEEEYLFRYSFIIINISIFLDNNESNEFNKINISWMNTIKITKLFGYYFRNNIHIKNLISKKDILYLPDSTKHNWVVFFSNNNNILLKTNDPNDVYSARELELLTHLHHPSILQGFRGKDSIFVDFIPGMNLRSFINMIRECVIKNQLQNFYNQHLYIIAYGIADALSHLHSLNYAHRDVSPKNILISTNNFYPILSGLKNPQICNDQYISDYQAEEKEYQAPEILDGTVQFPTKESDIYSFGMILYFLLTGYENKLTPDDIMRGERPQFPNFEFRVMKSIVMKCWDKEPSNRGTMKDIADMIYRYAYYNENSSLFRSFVDWLQKEKVKTIRCPNGTLKNLQLSEKAIYFHIKSAGPYKDIMDKIIKIFNLNPAQLNEISYISLTEKKEYRNNCQEVYGHIRRRSMDHPFSQKEQIIG